MLRGKRIPHEDKVFSIFELHTEWICKGKAGVPLQIHSVDICQDSCPTIYAASSLIPASST
ncbi:MAG: hypothetical protein KZQ71_00335 [Candidatus Thiodiazotropha sp. (ex Lucinoma aequizonata)]|nr:hypothetical protein [Candidatus Thiodiazotropha sp. (ex Lucinoma aequizonata)]